MTNTQLNQQAQIFHKGTLVNFIYWETVKTSDSGSKAVYVKIADKKQMAWFNDLHN